MLPSDHMAGKAAHKRNLGNLSLEMALSRVVAAQNSPSANYELGCRRFSRKQWQRNATDQTVSSSAVLSTRKEDEGWWSVVAAAGRYAMKWLLSANCHEQGNSAICLGATTSNADICPQERNAGTWAPSLRWCVADLTVQPAEKELQKVSQTFTTHCMLFDDGNHIDECVECWRQSVKCTGLFLA